MRLLLYKPLKTFIITQYFGQDLACINGKNEVITRETGKSCPAGFSSLYKHFGLKGHNGFDCAGFDWVAIYAANEGIAEELQTDPSLGLGIGIVSQNLYNFSGGDYYAKTRYWHLAAFNVKKGDIIKAGQLIGWIDNTGYSSGPHLHFELKPVLRKPDGTYYNVLKDNGYYGAIDPLPYLSPLSAFELNELFTRIRLWLYDLANQLQNKLNPK